MKKLILTILALSVGALSLSGQKIDFSLAADTETPGAKTITCEVRMQTAIGGTLASIWRLRYFAKHKDEN